MQKFHILLVEDHVDSANAMIVLLRSCGFTVKCADSILGAKRLFNLECFDVLLCDLGLPDGDGCDLLLDLSATRPVCAVAITGYGMFEDIERSKAAGFAAHLVKPIGLEQLQSVLLKISVKELCPQRDDSSVGK